MKVFRGIGLFLLLRVISGIVAYSATNMVGTWQSYWTVSSEDVKKALLSAVCNFL
jgi:hypothetical protein